MDKPCRCLLFEADEKELAANVSEYVNTLSPDIKADEKLYRSRLDTCLRCESLVGGMCVKCGCYVEIRAAVKNNYCPSEDKFW